MSEPRNITELELLLSGCGRNLSSCEKSDANLGLGGFSFFSFFILEENAKASWCTHTFCSFVCFVQTQFGSFDWLYLMTSSSRS